jgi:gamma-glutamyl:cysteine ligase YbdK (ATP-grasp superfamily)
MFNNMAANRGTYHSTRMNLRAMIPRGSAGRICHFENVKSYMSYLQQYTKIKKIIYKKKLKSIINNITKSCILNIKIRPLVTEYALMIKLVGGTSSTHEFNPYAYFGHSLSYFDIQNLSSKSDFDMNHCIK